MGARWFCICWRLFAANLMFYCGVVRQDREHFNHFGLAKICFVPQNMGYFRETSEHCWLECPVQFLSGIVCRCANSSWCVMTIHSDIFGCLVFLGPDDVYVEWSGILKSPDINGLMLICVFIFSSNFFLMKLGTPKFGTCMFRIVVSSSH